MMTKCDIISDGLGPSKAKLMIGKKDISYPEQQNWVSQILKCDYASALPDYEKAFYD